MTRHQDHAVAVGLGNGRCAGVTLAFEVVSHIILIGNAGRFHIAALPGAPEIRYRVVHRSLCDIVGLDAGEDGTGVCRGDSQ